MVQLTYSAAALEKVSSFSNIEPNDNNFIVASKYVSGFSLKVSVGALAAFEFVTRFSLLVIASPLYFFAHKTFIDMTETVKSSAQTILDAAASLAKFSPAEKKEDIPTEPPKTIRDRLNNVLAYASKNKKVIAIGVTLAVAAIGYHFLMILDKNIDIELQKKIITGQDSIIKAHKLMTETLQIEINQCIAKNKELIEFFNGIKG